MKNLVRLTDAGPYVDQSDSWELGSTDPSPSDNVPRIMPFNMWLELAHNLSMDESCLALLGVVLSADDDPHILEPWLTKLPLIALQFPDFRDGRAYSQAYLLRQRYGYTGELRAVEDVLRDQLSHMRQCGFDSFAIREDKSPEDALLGLAGTSVLYGRSVIEPRPLFRRGRV